MSDEILPPLIDWLRPKACDNAKRRFQQYGPMIAVRWQPGQYRIDPWATLDHVVHGGAPAGWDPVHWRETHLARGNEPFPVIIATTGAPGWLFVRGDLREAIVEAFGRDADMLMFREVPDGQCEHVSCRNRAERMAKYR
jgi:hypothetical protein